MGSLRDEKQDFSHISFIELDRLFEKSARALKRKKRKLRERGGRSVSRSGSPVAKKSAPGVGGYGGFSGKIGNVEKTVVVTTVPTEADERILFAHFSTCGTVEDVRILKNRHGTPTGVAILEFGQDEAVLRACSLLPPFNQIMGTVIQIKRADSQMTVSALAKVRQQKQMETVAAPLPIDPNLANAKKLHITNLRSIVTDDDLRGIFKPFGEIERIQMGKDECWITFMNNSDARDAMGSMQGFSLVGQELRIALVGPESGMPALTNRADPNNIADDTDFGATKKNKDADNATERLKLMAKLIDSRGNQFTPGMIPNIIIAGEKGWPSVPPPAKPGGPQTRTLLLQNMFNSKEVDLQKEPKFYNEIKEDTEEECRKFGKVLHIVVDSRGGTGQIYVCFEQPQMKEGAVNALNGRWFEGKKITAMGIDDAIWQALQGQLSSATGGATPAPQVPIVPQPGTGGPLPPGPLKT